MLPRACHGGNAGGGAPVPARVEGRGVVGLPRCRCWGRPVAQAVPAARGGGRVAHQMDVRGGARRRVAQGCGPGGGALDSAQAPVGVGGQDGEKRVEGAVGQGSSEPGVHLGGGGTGVEWGGHGQRDLYFRGQRGGARSRTRNHLPVQRCDREKTYGACVR